MLRRYTPSVRIAGLCLALAIASACAQPAPPAPSPHADKLRDQTDKNLVRGKRNQQAAIGNQHLPANRNHPPSAPPAPEQPEPTGPDPRNLQAPSFGDRLNLTSPWLFNTGSDNSFASPTLDDTTWQTVDTRKPLFINMLFNLNEVWYRAHIHLAPGSHNLALTVADFGGSYRVYANGQEIGGHGTMSGRGEYLISPSATYPIPDSALTQPDLVLAIHAFLGTVDRATFTLKDGLSGNSSVYLGPAPLLQRDQEAYFVNTVKESASILTLWAVLLLLATALAFLIPNVPFYPLLAIYAGGHLIGRTLLDYNQYHYYSRSYWLGWPINLAFIASQLAGLEFCRIVAGTPRRKILTIVQTFYVLALASLIPAVMGYLSFGIYAVLERIAAFLLLGAIFVLVLLGVRRKKQDAYILAAFAGVYLFYFLLWQALQYIVFDYAVLNQLSDWIEARFRPGPTGDFTIVAAFLALIILRTLRIVRERASIANEIEAARTMQQLLLARSTEPTPGFSVETVYLPAGEVGGDFFLVSPCTDEHSETSLTVIVGDVSGKGLRAAMRVSMILGVLRREPSREPAAMLHGLNQALLDQGDLGFTTACCLRLFPDGRFTAANAGHIAPYLAGPGTSREIATPPALPLGLAPDQDYEVFSGHLPPGHKLVLLSDGVLEARSHKGELFGFDRLLPLTRLPAADIAKVAQDFGQDDDITVLTIACTGPIARPAPAPPPRIQPVYAPPPPLTVARTPAPPPPPPIPTF